MSDPNDFNAQVIEEFRANDGVVGGYFEGHTLLLLHTVGAKSGEPRINPLVCLADDDQLFIIASAGGAPSHPAWYYNVVANPDVEVELGTERFKARAKAAEEPQRTDLYAKAAAQFPGFADYQKNTDRVIPVVLLERS